MAHTDIGKTLLAQFGEQCAEIANIERPAKLDGRHMSMFLGPKPTK
jgi:translation initiation factor IF-3